MRKHGVEFARSCAARRPSAEAEARARPDDPDRAVRAARVQRYAESVAGGRGAFEPAPKRWTVTSERHNDPAGGSWTCVVCGKKATVARGMCNPCYQRWWKRERGGER